MTAGPSSRYFSVQLSPEELAALNAKVEAERAVRPTLTRNAFIREWIASLKLS